MLRGMETRIIIIKQTRVNIIKNFKIALTSMTSPEDFAELKKKLNRVRGNSYADNQRVILINYVSS